MDRWKAFICYRQIDGDRAARWLYDNLQGATVPVEGESRVLEAYLDKAVPAVPDWQDVHGDALAGAKALVLVCTPGLFARIDDNDWVHKEIDWWLEQRDVAPVLVDASGEGARWIPKAVRRRWPNAQWITVDPEAWEGLSPSERETRQHDALSRILGGIAVTSTQTHRAELRRQVRVNRQLRLALGLLALVLVALVATGGAAARWSYQTALQKAESERQLAMSFLEDAELAWIEGQPLTARTLSAKAVGVSDDPGVQGRYQALEAWMDGRREEAAARMAESLEREFEEVLREAALPIPMERRILADERRRVLDNYLAVTETVAEGAAYDPVLRYRGLTHRPPRGSEDASRARTELQTAQAEFSAAFHADRRADEEAWSQRLGDAARGLAAAYRAVPTPPAVAPANWPVVQGWLDDGEVVVDFFRYHDRLTAWMLRSSGEPVRIDFGAAEAAERAAEEFTSGMGWGSASWDCPPRGSPWPATRGIVDLDALGPGRADGPCRMTPWAERFVRLVWRHVLDRLEPADETIYVVPVGALQTVNFAALPGRTAPELMLDEALMVHLGSVYDLAPRPAPQQRSKGVLLVGGVDYGDDARAIDPSSASADATPLPGTIREVEAIEALLDDHDGSRPMFALQQSMAREDNVRRRVAGRRIVHLAAHGVFDAAGAVPSDVLQSLIDSHDVDAYLVAIDPGLHAKMLLSPDEPDEGTGSSDGVLTALEVSELPLQDVELVVLSACGSATGEEVGQEPVSLYSAFRQAGVGSVVASVQLVTDDGTVELMGRFYRHLIDVDEPARALRRAARELRDEGQPAAVWAPFVSYGPLQRRRDAAPIEATNR
ncbi:MAG: CHAT domain-containing protein [Myxococcota bacterium]